MAISTFEGVVKDGQIRLRGNVQLPEDTEVYVNLVRAKGVHRVETGVCVRGRGRGGWVSGWPGMSKR